MDIARFNLSHGSYAEHEQRYHHVRKAAEETGRSVGILADLQGPKIRLGRFREGPVLLERGDTFTITVEPLDNEGDGDICGTTYDGLAADVTTGERILVDDGRVTLEVTDVDGPRVHTTVIEEAWSSDNKGLNLPGVAVSVPPLSDKDIDDLRWPCAPAPTSSPSPFVRTGRDIDDVHRIMDEENRRLPVIAKVEKPQAVENIDDIVAAFDGIMVAPATSASKCPSNKSPSSEARHQTRQAQRQPVIVATQMLDSMIDNSRPTRAEASDVANAVIDGTDAVMLSGETSVGKYPIETVRTMSRIVEAAEQDILAKGLPPLTERNKPRTQGGAVARAAAEMGDFLGAKVLVAFTGAATGRKRLSRYPHPSRSSPSPRRSDPRPAQPHWASRPSLGPKVDSTDAMVAQVDEELLRIGRCAKGDIVVITAGSPPGVAAPPTGPRPPPARTTAEVGRLSISARRAHP
ncbi:pyruvate kinase [Streptomyces sp. COG19]|uniref:pyruvate kinase n=1 Tax=Streptomyces sp. COG19 TaxID=2838870 RepID=UPI001BE9D5E5|nr:pyruvate kinase [Streptomyces sp. COG19]MBT3104803.1 pyruvate kinase [Streptomyces sp. COG19]